MVDFADILNGKVAPPAESAPFLAAVKKYSTQAREQGSVNERAPATDKGSPVSEANK
jgi:hypothetical protein